MKGLNEYCKLMSQNKWRYKLPDINGYRTFAEFCDINNFDEDSITEDAVNFYYTYNVNEEFNRHKINYTELICEGLKSYDTDKLISKLNKEFKSEIRTVKYMSSDKDSKCVPVVLEMSFGNKIIDDSSFDKHNWNYLSNNSLMSTNEADKFKGILKFYGYYITLTSKEMGTYYIYLEPETTKDVFNDVLSGGGYIYHVTAKDNLQKIKRRGLVPRAGKKENEGGYRYFPERIYFVKHNNNKEQLKKSLQTIINDKRLDENYIILKISLKRHNIGLYLDKAYTDSNNVYTYESIPSDIINVITDINKL